MNQTITASAKAADRKTNISAAGQRKILRNLHSFGIAASLFMGVAVADSSLTACGSFLAVFFALTINWKKIINNLK